MGTYLLSTMVSSRPPCFPYTWPCGEHHIVTVLTNAMTTRYYSDIDAQVENGTVKLDCVWLGAKGYKQGYSTGIRIHFPEFNKGFIGNGNDEQ